MAAARSSGLETELMRASNDSEADAAFAALTMVHAGGLLISADSFLFSRKERLAALAARYAMSAIFGFREFAAAGGVAG
jgi:putative ABC transport system substrate-binding protein